MRPTLIVCLLGACTSAPGDRPVAEWSLVEELRIGGNAEDPEGFNTIKGLLLNKRGELWVLEASTHAIHVLDSSGKFLRKFGRQGQGPGEFVWPDGMAMAPNGQVWVHDGQNARFSVFSDSGVYIRQHLTLTVGWAWTWTGGIDTSGTVWDPILRGPDDTLQRVTRTTSDASRTDTLVVPSCQFPRRTEQDGFYTKQDEKGGYSLGIPYYPEPIAVFDWNGGALWCAPNSAEYRLTRLSLVGHDTLANVVTRADPVPVSASERDAAIAEIRESLRKMTQPDEDWSRIPSVKPKLVAAFVDDSQRLWVRRSSTNNSDSVFDIYAESGFQVANLRIPHRMINWVRPIIRGSTIWLVASDKDDAPYVVRARFGS